MTKFQRGLVCTVSPAHGFSPTLKGVVHLQDIGDMLLYDGAWAGTKGQSRRLEGFSVQITPGVEGLGLQYMAHLQDTADTAWVNEGEFCGTRGQSRRLEGFAFRLTGPEAGNFDIFYQGHLQDSADTGVFSNGAFCGTRGQARRCEAIKVWIVAK